MTACQIFFKLKFSEFIQNFRTLNVFGKFLLIVNYLLNWSGLATLPKSKLLHSFKSFPVKISIAPSSKLSSSLSIFATTQQIAGAWPWPHTYDFWRKMCNIRAKAELPLEGIFFALNFLPWEFSLIKKLEIKETKTT